jgi:hypothetical protein
MKIVELLQTLKYQGHFLSNRSSNMVYEHMNFFLNTNALFIPLLETRNAASQSHPIGFVAAGLHKYAFTGCFLTAGAILGLDWDGS